ncbi:L-seryl-tRNA(Sec) selenium transferase, partial [Dehalococcoidia bacterium]|nr:L-seryl-tRNA(Sec) selenium transferase [Dehalococcoidia bacterium]
YSNLELDLDSGGRGSRHVHVENLLRRLTGAQAAIAVNNNASALLLGLMTLANAGEVIISRGEAVEIGGGFRIPDVLEQSGATLIEVGTTNRTYASDYNSAINSNTAALLKVHTSNFKVSGFVHTPTLAEMMQLGTRHKIPVLHDIGSGCLLETTAYGMTHEPTPQESVRAGVDLSFFSGDKLLGGPQSGIIVGKKKYVDRLKASPLARAVRLDKMTLAALTATLLHYITGQAKTKIPVWQMISADLKTLESRVKKWIRYAGEQACIIDSVSTIGGGSLPGEYLPSKVLAIKGTGAQLNKLARRLRKGTPAVLARIDGEMLLIDPRTVLPNQDQIVAGAIRDALGTS